MLFHWNMSRRPFLGQVVDWDLLLCQFETYGFVPMPHFYSETNEWLQDWPIQWAPALLCLVTSSREFQWQCSIDILFHIKLKSVVTTVTSQNLQSIKTFLTLELSQLLVFFVKRTCCCQQQLNNFHQLCNSLCLCSPVQPAQALPERCPKSSAIVFSGIACGSNCQMTGRGWNLELNLNFATWPTSCKDLCAPKSLNSFCSSVEDAEIETSSEHFQPASPRLYNATFCYIM